MDELLAHPRPARGAGAGSGPRSWLRSTPLETTDHAVPLVMAPQAEPASAVPRRVRNGSSRPNSVGGYLGAAPVCAPLRLKETHDG
jgi:hypothetical protein